MNVSTLLQNVVATRKERAFRQAVAPLLAGKRRLVAHAVGKVTLNRETLQAETTYTPAVQNVLDYYDREIEKVRRKRFDPRPKRSFTLLTPKPHVHV